MKKAFVFSLASLLMSAFAGTAAAAVPETKENDAVKNETSCRVLVVGMSDNIVSDYFSRDMLVEGTDISEDSICAVYNKVIENGLSATASKEKSAYAFVTAPDAQSGWATLTKHVRLEGEEDKTAADLSAVSGDKLKALMDKAGAAYLLVLDAHYMKFQEKPFKTLFHYVNYSLYDDRKNKLAQGSNYFTSINPQNTVQMAKSSRKSAEKIVEMVEKTLD